ncbi:DNA-binding response regulator, LytR/AlgR family [Tenacibaculum sp. MAR_2009_124]|uniref:LytTR family DNA-binding domain-containing protein n=1 Tax=Tenacibaculum sp. MAR_2009_124 TaxID=1250059 RepID=UPI00089D6DB0|nr:LytTR family DNA-binding domain-containing protein [Tenacibaculum sp. MAR_2009_124]SEB38206.1 DNA-binding response regulator, LytR/AlgR family [Tenacibaculum sp. MAR_2009_124]
MQKKIQYHFLRSPFYVLSSYFVLLLPEFINSCNHKTVISSFWNVIPLCSKEFVFTRFLGNSIKSILLLIICFEVFRILGKYFNLKSLPTGLGQWLQFESKLLIVTLLSFLGYMLIAYFFAWGSDTMNDLSIVSVLYRIIIVTYLGIHGVLLLSYLVYKKNPLNQKIEVKSSIGEKSFSVNEMIWFEKKGRNYFANSKDAAIQVEFNLSELEEMLSKKHFFRINRAVIINITEVEEITRWENEKYIVKLANNQKFVGTRKRIVELKKLITELN